MGAPLVMILLATVVARTDASAASANTHYRSVGALRLEEVSGATDIVAGELVLVSITDEEARRQGGTRRQIAAGYIGHIKHSISTAFSASILMLFCFAGIRFLSNTARYTE